MDDARKAFAPPEADSAASAELPAQALQILHFERRREDSKLVSAALEEEQIRCEILRVDSRDDFLTALRECRIQLVLADFFDPTLDGLSLLQFTRDTAPGLPVIFLVADITPDESDAALRHGAAAVVSKNQ